MLRTMLLLIASCLLTSVNAMAVPPCEGLLKDVLVLGGNRFFGHHLVENLIRQKSNVTILNRGTYQDEHGDKVQRVVCDREDAAGLKAALKGKTFGTVYDLACNSVIAAHEAKEIFANVTSQYILVSSASVYRDYGLSVRENEFDPSSYFFDHIAMAQEDYGEAKRQIEAVLSRAPYPVKIVRPVVITGADDYQERVNYYVERTVQQRPIVVTDPDSRFSMIDSRDLGKCLLALGNKNFEGVINCASSDSLSVGELVSMIEEETGKEAIITQPSMWTFHSPTLEYGGNIVLNTETLAGFDIKPRTIRRFIRPLIRQLAFKAAAEVQ